MNEINTNIQSATVQALSSSGEGVCRVNEKVYFIPFVLPGEVIDFKETKSSSNYSNGECQGVTIKSISRAKHSPLEIGRAHVWTPVR